MDIDRTPHEIPVGSSRLASLRFLFSKGIEHTRFVTRLDWPATEAFLNSTVEPDQYDFCQVNDLQASDLAEVSWVVIEDEWWPIRQFIAAATHVIEAHKVLICTGYGAIEHLLEMCQNPPLLVTLDFLIGTREELMAGRTERLFQRINRQWKNATVLGVTNFESDKDIKPLENRIRAAGGHVYDKGMVWGLFPNILRDGLVSQLLRSKPSINPAILDSESLALSEDWGLKPEVKQDDFEEEVTITDEELKRFEMLAMPLIGDSRFMQNLRRFILDEADHEGFTLIRGERGTGKEVVANAIHFIGPRKNKPFVVVNCAAIPDNLWESEFFGIKDRVASDVSGKKGYFEQAKGGTLFLDEIGDMPLIHQAKMLRLLEKPQQLNRVGSDQSGVDKPIYIGDVKVVMATNKNLEDMVADKLFREDLYDRIIYGANFPMLLPLRERPSDILAIAEHALAQHPQIQLSAEARKALFMYDWPGNCRELLSVMAKVIRNAPRFLTSRAEVPYWVQKVAVARFLKGKPLASAPTLQVRPAIRQDRLSRACDLLDEMEAALGRLGHPSSITQELLAGEMKTLSKGNQGYSRSVLSGMTQELKTAIQHLLHDSEYANRWSHLRSAYAPIRKLMSS